MRKLITLLCTLIVFGGSSYGSNYALIIGIDNYSGHWTPLNNAVNDCKAMDTILRTQYAFDHVLTLFDHQATRKNVLSKLHDLESTVGPKDNLLIYYAGHGFLDGVNEGYWVPYDAFSTHTYLCISNADILNAIARIHSNHTLLISDACFSGTLFRSSPVEKDYNDFFYDNMKKIPSRQALTSGGLQEVVDGPSGKHSVFAEYLLKKLEENDKPNLEVGELAYYLKIAVPANTPHQQQPLFGQLQMTGHEGGSFVFEKRVPLIANKKSGNRDTKTGKEHTLDDKVQIAMQTNCLNFYSGKKGGTYYSISTEIANLCNIPIRVKESSGSGENLNSCSSQIDTFALAMVQGDIFYKEKEKYPSLHILSILYLEEFHLLTTQSSDISSLADLKEKRIGIPGKESGTAFTFHEIDSFLDLQTKVVYKEENELFQALLDRKIDALFFIGGAPLTFLSTLDTTLKAFIRLVPVHDFRLNRLYDQCIIKKTNYEWLDKDVPSYGISSFLVSNEPFGKSSKSSAVVQSILKNQSTLSQYGHPKWKDFNVTLNATSVKLPPGIRKMY